MPELKPIRRSYTLEMLSPQDLEACRTATLHTLGEVGVRFPSELALEVFEDSGAQVDWGSRIVRIPPDLVSRAMSQAPRSFMLAGRDEGTELHLDGATSYFGTDGCGVETLDVGTGKPRPSTKDDVATMARVADYLSSVAFYWPMVSAQDCGRTAPLHEIEASFRNTVKHVQTETVMGQRPAQLAIRMAEVIAGSTERLQSHPPLSAVICTIAPLSQDKEGIESAMTFARSGIPVGFMSMPTLGSTAPATVGGALTVGNAEIISAMVLIQLIAPGASVFHSLLASVMDPRSGAYMIGIPEKFICNTAAIQIAHDWGVPALAGVFAMDSEAPDNWRMGRDSVYTALLAGMAGAELAEGLGMLRASTLLLPEQIVFDDEIYHMNRLVAGGVDVSPQGLALDVIADVGPGGHFLALKHTREHVRRIWIPELTRPRPRPSEERLPELGQRARAEFDRILEEHTPEPLDSAAADELEAILKGADAALAI